jgi:hypothetical protein
LPPPAAGGGTALHSETGCAPACPVYPRDKTRSAKNRKNLKNKILFPRYSPKNAVLKNCAAQFGDQKRNTTGDRGEHHDDDPHPSSASSGRWGLPTPRDPPASPSKPIFKPICTRKCHPKPLWRFKIDDPAPSNSFG